MGGAVLRIDVGQGREKIQGANRVPGLQSEYVLLPHLGLGFDTAGGDIAQLLTAGLVFDTASFAHSNTTPRTLRAASGRHPSTAGRCAYYLRNPP